MASSDNHSFGQAVVLLHGFLKGPYELLPASYYLHSKGYETHRLGYPTHHGSITDIADLVWAKLQKKGLGRPDVRLNFVAHSMGGLVVNELINRQKPRNLGRVVMWGSPLTGCEFADKLNDSAMLGGLFKRLGGQAGQELQVKSLTPDKVMPITYDAGVIAGVSNVYPFSDIFIKDYGPHDGIVPLKRTKREGLRDHVVLKVSHSGMLLSPAVFRQTDHYLRHGRFLAPA